MVSNGGPGLGALACWWQAAGLSRMSQSALTDLVKELAFELAISDATALPAAVRKLKRVVAAVPPLEDFVTRVCDIVSSHSGGSVPRSTGVVAAGGTQYLETVLGVVLQWAHGAAERVSTEASPV